MGAMSEIFSDALKENQCDGSMTAHAEAICFLYPRRLFPASLQCLFPLLFNMVGWRGVNRIAAARSDQVIQRQPNSSAVRHTYGDGSNLNSSQHHTAPMSRRLRRVCRILRIESEDR
jgi:hypothetical protein